MPRAPPGSQMFLGAHPGTPYFPPALGCSNCVQVLCVSCVYLLCALQSLVPKGCYTCKELRSFQRLPGIDPTVCSAKVTQDEPVPVVRRDLSPGAAGPCLGVSGLWSQTAWCETPILPLTGGCRLITETLSLTCSICEVGTVVVCASSDVTTTGL